MKEPTLVLVYSALSLSVSPLTQQQSCRAAVSGLGYLFFVHPTLLFNIVKLDLEMGSAEVEKHIPQSVSRKYSVTLVKIK